MVSVDTSLLSVSETDELVTIELSRPDKLNALNPEMVEGLHSLFGQLHEDPGRGVLLTGEGRVTTAGMDRDIVSQDDYHARFGDLDETLGEVYRLIQTYPAPVVIVGRGALLGAGLMLSLFCEFLVLGEDATYGIPEIEYGIASERIAEHVPAMAGKRIGLELALTGEPIEPERAYGIGLANDVVPPEDVEDRARELLSVVGQHDEDTVAYYIRMIQGGGAGA